MATNELARFTRPKKGSRPALGAGREEYRKIGQMRWDFGGRRGWTDHERSFGPLLDHAPGQVAEQAVYPERGPRGRGPELDRGAERLVDPRPAQVHAANLVEQQV